MKNFNFKLLLIGMLSIALQNVYAQKIPGTDLPLPFSGKKDTSKKDSVKKVVPPPAVKSYASVITKAFKSQKGLFTVHTSKDLIYFEIPDSILRRDIMVINSLNKGPGGFGVFPGEELSQNTIEFEKGRDSVINIRLNLVINEADSTSSIAKAVRESSLSPIVLSLPILCYGPDSKSYVIDGSKLVKEKSIANAIDATTNLGKKVTAVTMKDFYIENIHTYPENVEISVRQNMESKPSLFAPTLTQVTIESHTSFIALPKVPLQRRYADPRVGYFADYYYAFGDKQQKSEMREFIVRWRLEPKDADLARWKNGELVEPKKPIVIYIDPATPKQWRPYLIEGINDWQKAFEGAGFKNAIIGKEWPENDSTMHRDDARYSFINYFPSNIANAYGPQIHDPRSGEIIQTHIGWYHNVMSILHDWYLIQTAAVDPSARKPKFDEKLMGQLVRFVSSHEVGHTLGLKHNFGSSSLTPVDSLRSNSYLTRHGHTASIMDYARFNYVAQPEDHITQINLFPRIGEYDKWAIEWGYKISGAKDADEDKKIINKWTMERASRSKLTWFGDGETEKGDPRSQTEDLGDNAAKASIYGIKNLKRILPNLPEWTKGEGGVNSNLLDVYNGVQSQYFLYMNHVLKNIGGVYHDVRGEEQSGAAYSPVSANMLKESLEFFNTQLFQTPYWLLDKKVAAKVAIPKNPDFISDTQVRVLNSLMDQQKVSSIQALAIRYGRKAVSVKEYITLIHKGIWKELHSPGAVRVDSYRRTLQKAYVGSAYAILSARDPEQNESDLFSFMKIDLERLQGEIKAASSRTKDELTRYHFKDLSGRIDDMLHPRKS